MARARKKKRTVYLDTPTITFYKRRSMGRDRPALYIIQMNEEDESTDHHIELSRDDLFDLADALDDVCDAISDGVHIPGLV